MNTKAIAIGIAVVIAIGIGIAVTNSSDNFTPDAETDENIETEESPSASKVVSRQLDENIGVSHP